MVLAGTERNWVLAEEVLPNSLFHQLGE